MRTRKIKPREYIALWLLMLLCCGLPWLLGNCRLEVSPRFGQHTGNGPTIVGTKPIPKDASDD